MNINSSDWLNIIGLALSCGSFFALFVDMKQARMLVVAGVIISTIASVWLLKKSEQEKIMHSTELAQAWILKRTHSPASFEDIFSESYYPSFDIIESAVDNLVVSGRIEQHLVEVVHGETKHKIRLYTSTTKQQ